MARRSIRGWWIRLESAGVVLEEQGEHTRIGVVAEGGRSEFGEPLALIGRHWIADGVVVEANGRGRALIEEAEFFGGVFVAEAERSRITPSVSVASCENVS